MVGGFVYIPDSLTAKLIDAMNESVVNIEYPGAYELVSGIYKSGKMPIFRFIIDNQQIYTTGFSGMPSDGTFTLTTPFISGVVKLSTSVSYPNILALQVN